MVAEPLVLGDRFGSGTVWLWETALVAEPLVLGDRFGSGAVWLWETELVGY